MVLVPFDTYGCLFDSLSLLGCHVGAAAGCATAGTGGIRESGKYSSTCTYTHIIKYIFLYMQYSVCYMYSCYQYFENVRYISTIPGERSGGYLSSVISGNCNVQARIPNVIFMWLYTALFFSKPATLSSTLISQVHISLHDQQQSKIPQMSAIPTTPCSIYGG